MRRFQRLRSATDVRAEPPLRQAVATIETQSAIRIYDCNTAHGAATQRTGLQHSAPRCKTTHHVATQHTALQHSAPHCKHSTALRTARPPARRRHGRARGNAQTTTGRRAQGTPVSRSTCQSEHLSVRTPVSQNTCQSEHLSVRTPVSQPHIVNRRTTSHPIIHPEIDPNLAKPIDHSIARGCPMGTPPVG